MRFRGPLADRYPAAVALVVFALIPYLVLSAAMTPLEPTLGKALRLDKQALALANGMANASAGTLSALRRDLRRLSESGAGI